MPWLSYNVSCCLSLFWLTLLWTSNSFCGCLILSVLFLTKLLTFCNCLISSNQPFFCYYFRYLYFYYIVQSSLPSLCDIPFFLFYFHFALPTYRYFICCGMPIWIGFLQSLNWRVSDARLKNFTRPTEYLQSGEWTKRKLK